MHLFIYEPHYRALRSMLGEFINPDAWRRVSRIDRWTCDRMQGCRDGVFAFIANHPHQPEPIIQEIIVCYGFMLWAMDDSPVRNVYERRHLESIPLRIPRQRRVESTNQIEPITQIEIHVEPITLDWRRIERMVQWQATLDPRTRHLAIDNMSNPYMSNPFDGDEPPDPHDYSSITNKVERAIALQNAITIYRNSGSPDAPRLIASTTTNMCKLIDSMTDEEKAKAYDNDQ